jgi:hypothetical protein
VILHNVPLAYSVHTKDSYARIRTLLNYIDFDKYKWKICRDLKVLALLLGVQQGYTKCSWF